MKFSGKIEDGTSNKPVNFGCNPDHDCLLVALVCLFVCLCVSICLLTGALKKL